MTVTLFISLLTVFSAVTGLLTEATKKVLNDREIKYSANILAVIIAYIVGMCGTTAYYILFNLSFNAANIVCIFLLGIGTSAGAMIGYDKVIQTIQQIKLIHN